MESLRGFTCEVKNLVAKMIPPNWVCPQSSFCGVTYATNNSNFCLFLKVEIITDSQVVLRNNKERSSVSSNGNDAKLSYRNQGIDVSTLVFIYISPVLLTFICVFLCLLVLCNFTTCAGSCIHKDPFYCPFIKTRPPSYPIRPAPNPWWPRICSSFL